MADAPTKAETAAAAKIEPVTPLDPEKYGSAYPDLAMLHSEEGADALVDHWNAFGRAEGRIAAPVDRPDDWSETLSRELLGNPLLVELLDLGIVATSFHYAAAHNSALAEAGRASLASQLCRATHLPEAVLGEMLDIDRASSRSSLLFDLYRGATMYQPLRAPILAASLDAVRSIGWTYRGCQLAIVLPWLRAGGAELEALWLYRAADQAGLKPVMILTETSDVSPFFAEQELRTVSLPSLLEAVSGLGYGEIYITARKAALDLVITALGAANMHVVHSWTAYHMLIDWARFGREARPKVVVSAFCSHLHADGRIDGYFRMFPDIDGVVDLYLFDNDWYSNQIHAIYGVPAKRRATLRFPVSQTRRSPREPGRTASRKMLWASRIDFQKNLPILFDVAARMPDITFDVFGSQVLNDASIDWNEAPGNIVYRGEYFDFTQLPHGAYDGFIYTSLFDGMPNVVLEAAQAALPIVSAPAGGVGEFLDDGVGLIVGTPHDVDGYVAGVRRLVNDPAFAAGMTRAALDRLERDRTFVRFARAVGDQGIYADPSPVSSDARPRQPCDKET